MTAEASGADGLANTLLTSLIAGKSFTVPDVEISSDLYGQPATTGPLYDDITRIDLADLTTGKVGGSGAFDQLMVSMVNHLKVEFEANRISGAEYTKAYIGVVGAILQTAQQFILTKEQSYWSALLVQQQARTAQIQAATTRLELETARVALARAQYEASTAEANYALVKMKLATEDATYTNLVKQSEHTDAQILQVEAETAHVTAQTAGVTFTNTNILPAQQAQLEAETAQSTAQTAGIIYTNTNLLPAQLAGTEAQTAHISEQTVGVTYTNANILPAQKIGIDNTNANLVSQGEGIDFTNENILPKQADLLAEQVEVQRAQTSNTRTDNVTVAGLIGKQKDLYTQQITSYQRDSETKAVKIFSDAWTVQKTQDDGLLAPDQFTNTNINEMLLALRANLNMGS